MAAVWEHADCSQTALLVLLALADHANDAGECWPSYPRLAQRARTSERHVRRVMLDLEERGLIARDRRSGFETHYTLTVGEDTRVPGRGDPQVPGTPASRGTPRSAKGGPGRPGRGDPQVPRTTNEPTTEPSTTTAGVLAAAGLDQPEHDAFLSHLGKTAKDPRALVHWLARRGELAGRITEWQHDRAKPATAPRDRAGAILAAAAERYRGTPPQIGA